MCEKVRSENEYLTLILSMQHECTARFNFKLGYSTREASTKVQYVYGTMERVFYFVKDQVVSIV